MMQIDITLSPLAGRGAAPRYRGRAAYTMMEIAVVVALIVVIGALTIPSIMGSFADARVNGSADIIRARMADARSMAMEQGRPFRFGFVSGSSKFQIAPDDSRLWDTVQDSEPVEDDEHIRGELLQDVIFGTDMNSISGSDTPTPGGTWQPGGVFLPEGTARAVVNPDGTTVDDVTFFFGKAGLSPMAVRLRGLTGAVRVFDPTAEGDQP